MFISLGYINKLQTSQRLKNLNAKAAQKFFKKFVLSTSFKKESRGPEFESRHQLKRENEHMYLKKALAEKQQGPGMEAGAFRLTRESVFLSGWIPEGR